MNAGYPMAETPEEEAARLLGEMEIPTGSNSRKMSEVDYCRVRNLSNILVIERCLMDIVATCDDDDLGLSDEELATISEACKKVRLHIFHLIERGG